MAFDATHYPDCTWRPYAADSPFNTPVKAPKLDPRSADMMAYTKFDIPQNKPTGTTGTADYGHPIYFGNEGDPTYTVKLTKGWGTQQMATFYGAKIHAPRGLLPAGGGDGHLGIIDQATGTEYCFWQAKVDETSRVITASWGGYCDIWGMGVTSQPATAAWFGLSLHNRAVELAGGIFDHAAFIVPTFVDKPYWSPAKGNAQIASNALWPEGVRPHTGQRLWCDYTFAEIDALAEPSWGKALLRQFARYGGLVGDTGHYGTVGVNVMWESQQPYATFLRTNPLKDWLASQKMTSLPAGALLERHRAHFHWLDKP